ncbi:uncharacterized protein LOC122502085 [Leptopilina heterotoma]|uniref:uncharacterized protein LOC122502085 n=1 Tax=Leptopilina heterotoma TaxID=63436 RepID=UPI001CA7FD26|nr:uncharacterized protein LOC122502085 [Leptopilina heterotoma]XP_043467908.1 uncharacterized protein LOC122502085 [Leptopilina heterotoma]XP_043467909.1 uncharacterized protein LOC122502085 [Leptopilina heterotoma]XP_043467910.1 uncharacterized protein LOC122502085 [Leptopilina heterotoma]
MTTPAGILHNLMQKKFLKILEYELIFDGSSLKQNVSFTYQVTCDGFVKTGSGFSKKEAKQNAAKAILDEMFPKADTTSNLQEKSINSHQESPSSSDIPPQIQSNDDFHPQFSIDEPLKIEPPPKIEPIVSILPKVEPDSSLNIPKALENACTLNNLAIPEYNIEKLSGTSNFRVECVVSSFKETATATTLEIAKQEAARKAWAKLQIEFQKDQCIKKEEKSFDELIRSSENLLQSYTSENESKENYYKRKRRFSEERATSSVKKEKHSDEVIEIFDYDEKLPKRKRILEVKKENKNIILTKTVREKPSDIPILNTVEVLNQMCTDINLQKPKYEYKIVDPKLAEFLTVTCTISTFKVSAYAKTKSEANQEVAKRMIEKIQRAVRKLQTSEKFDLQSEEAQFFVNGTVISMLEKLSQQNNSASSSKSRRMENNFEQRKVKSKNPIQMLKELCKSNNIKKPQFETIEENLFYSDKYKVACIVSTFKEESEGTCFEEAKIKSAQKMLERLTKMQNSYLEQLIESVKNLDYKNPSRWKTKN